MTKSSFVAKNALIIYGLKKRKIDVNKLNSKNILKLRTNFIVYWVLIFYFYFQLLILFSYKNSRFNLNYENNWKYNYTYLNQKIIILKSFQKSCLWFLNSNRLFLQKRFLFFVFYIYIFSLQIPIFPSYLNSSVFFFFISLIINYY